MGKKRIYTLFALLLAVTLSGCDSSPIAKQYLSEVYCSLPFTCSEDSITLDLRVANYTGYEIYDSSIHELSDKDMSSGGYGAVSWNKRNKSPVTVKVWWQVIYDSDKANNDTNHNRRLEKRSAYGTVWCEAIVKIKPPYPVDPSHLYLYFFPDGHVEVEVGGEVVDMQDPYRRMRSTVKIYTDTQKTAFPRRHDGKYCDKIIDNPWFGVDTSNPWT